MDRLLDRYASDKILHRFNRVPARLDYIQSATGLVLALFMWGHMILVSSILLGENMMYKVARFFEGYYFFGESIKEIPMFVAGVVFFIFILHAAVALRKFPNNFKQFRMFRAHMLRFDHTDTKLWFVQVMTGFSMFFLGSVHLYVILTNPGNIGPYASSDRFVYEWMWPLYLLLLLAVELHGSIGLYRLSIKWGWFDGKNYKETRAKLKKVKWAITVFFLALGILTLLAYVKIGIAHLDEAGQRYVPTEIAG